MDDVVSEALDFYFLELEYDLNCDPVKVISSTISAYETEYPELIIDLTY